jgi:hypothetical protein
VSQGVVFHPTDEHRRQVEVLAGLGLPQQQIAVLVNCDPKTLRKHFDLELELCNAKATAKIAQTLFNKALGGDTATLIFWMKVRAGWREVARVEVSGPDGGPVELVHSARERISARLEQLAARQVGSDLDDPAAAP